MSTANFFQAAGTIVLMAPIAMTAILGIPALIRRPPGEVLSSRLTQVGVSMGACAAISILVGMIVTGQSAISVDFGEWVHIEKPSFHFHLQFMFDRLSLPFVLLSYLLCGTISAFASKYLHREPGFLRFYVLFSIFLAGMTIASAAGTIETLFAGWELVGLSSALLVAFFQDRPSPVRNGLRVWVVYRIADAALLMAAVALHHATGEGNFFQMMGDQPWPQGESALTAQQATFVGALLLIAAAGKSALLPFSGWLPRAMEGPTPSSAIFYGALSVHLGAFLLLRTWPIWESSLALRVAIVVLGLATSAFATAASRVRTDIKSALSYASLTQVGLIVAEIGMGWSYVALVHLIGHACLRTLQLLRAPSLLRDWHALENATGGRLQDTRSTPAHARSGWLAHWSYRLAYEQGFLDATLSTWIVDPFLALFRKFDSLERRWTDWISGRKSRESDRIAEVLDPLEDLS